MNSFISNLSTKKIICLFSLIGFFIYGRALFHGFVGDDLYVLVQHPSAHSLFDLGRIFSSGNFADENSNYYKPFVYVVYSMISFFFGNTPFPFHLVQVLLHIANSILVFSIFKNFLNKELSILLALVFLVHPINTESVVYIANLQENLFLFFGLLALKISSNKPKRFLLVTILLLLSILSKETGVVFLVILPTFNYLFKKEKMLKSILQSGVALMIYLFLRLFVAQIYLNKLSVVPIMELSFMERLINIPKIIFYYLKTFFYPNHLITFHTWIVESVNLRDFYLPLLLDLVFFLVLFIFLVFFYRKRKDLFNTLLFFVIWFILGLSIHLQLIPLDQTVADRWFYFPIIGLLGFFGVTLEYFFAKQQIKFTNGILFIFLVIITILSIRTVLRVGDWKDNNTLMSQDIMLNPDSYQLHTAVAYKFLTAGDIKKAEYHFLKAASFFPSPITYTNLGHFYGKVGRIRESKYALQNAIKYGSFCRAYNNLAIVLLVSEGPRSAKFFSQNSLKKAPECYQLWVALAMSHHGLGETEDALRAAEKAYSISKNIETANVLQIIKSGEPVQVKLN